MFNTREEDKAELRQDCLGIIERWRSRSFAQGDTVEEFMEMMAKRAFVFCGSKIDPTDPIDFVMRMRGVLSFAKEISDIDDPVETSS